MSQASSKPSTYRKRMLQIKGVKGAEQKARFNEDVDVETRSIRQDAAMKSTLNALMKRNSQPDIASLASGIKSSRSRASIGLSSN